MHDWPLVHRYDGFKCLWTIAQCTVWSLSIVVTSPLFDDDLCFPLGVEALCVRQFISEPAIEAFKISILPRIAWIDLQRLDAYLFRPVLQVRRNELRPVVRTDKLWLAMFHQQRVQCVQKSCSFILGRTATHSASRVYSSRTVSIL